MHELHTAVRGAAAMRACVLALMLVAAACGSEAATTTDAGQATDTTGAPAEAESTSSVVADEPEQAEGNGDGEADPAPAATDLSELDTCGLLDDATIAAVLGDTFEAEWEPGSEENGFVSACNWKVPGGIDLTESGLNGVVLWGISEGTYELSKQFWPEHVLLDTIGDEAYSADDGSFLYVTSGGSAFVVSLLGSSDLTSGDTGQATMLALAEDVIANIPA